MAQTPQSSVLSRVTQQWNGILSNPNFKEKSSVSLRACLVWGMFGLLPYQKILILPKPGQVLLVPKF